MKRNIKKSNLGPLNKLFKTRRGPKALGLILSLSLIAILNTSCGDGGSSPSASGQSVTQTALIDNEATKAALLGLLPVEGCPHETHFLAMDTASWEIKNGYNYNIDDVWEIRENCSLRTYECGSLGYLSAGGKDFNDGLATFVILGHITPNQDCLTPGTHSCKYTRDGSSGLRLDCQLTQPLDRAFP